MGGMQTRSRALARSTPYARIAVEWRGAKIPSVLKRSLVKRLLGRRYAYRNQNHPKGTICKPGSVSAERAHQQAEHLGQWPRSGAAGVRWEDFEGKLYRTRCEAKKHSPSWYHPVRVGGFTESRQMRHAEF